MSQYFYNSICLVLLIAFCFVAVPVSSLECYVCTEQEGNTDKCTNTVKTCGYEQDTCLTELRWGSTPYWSQGAEKQYYVTKTCANRTYCETRRNDFIPYCHRIWYEDWKCAECCQGDRCNYYVVLGAGNLQVSWCLVVISTIAALIHLKE